MLERKKIRPKITLRWIAIGIIVLAGTGILLQKVLEKTPESCYFQLLLIFIFGFAFLIIAWKLKYG